jgi:putative toxin-antitoxin system antitoxin component (TIGR02293 family)
MAKEKGQYEPLLSENIISIDIGDDLLKRAVEVFEDEDKALQCLISPNYAFGGRRPGELSETPDGRQNVLDELMRIERGVFA